MGLLKKAVVEQAGAKIGIFGAGGSGKSLTSALMMIALSKTYHAGAPVAMMDTERASDWLLDVFKLENVELLRVKSRAFADMPVALTEAEAAGACAFNVDSYSHPWAELQAALKKKLNVRKLEFHHMQELQDLWGGWVNQFLASPLHIILSGRLAYEWENEEDAETGKMGFHKAGTKMRSEKDAGYEPHLLLEMEAVRQMDVEREVTSRGRKKTMVKELKAGGRYVHRLHVLKDRARVLNGRSFDFADINNYKAGDWKHVFKVLEPHFAKMNIGGTNIVDAKRSSEFLLEGRGNGAERGRRRDIALEEIKESIAAVFPGMDASSKRARQVVLEEMFGTLSWSRVEAKRVEDLETSVPVLVEFRKRVKDDRERLSTEDGIVSEIKLSRDIAELQPDADEMPVPTKAAEEAVL